MRANNIFLLLLKKFVLSSSNNQSVSAMPHEFTAQILNYFLSLLHMHLAITRVVVREGEI